MTHSLLFTLSVCAIFILTASPLVNKLILGDSYVARKEYTILFIKTCIFFTLLTIVSQINSIESFDGLIKDAKMLRCNKVNLEASELEPSDVKESCAPCETASQIFLENPYSEVLPYYKKKCVESCKDKNFSLNILKNC